ncbi:cytidylate kinase-like family protein [Caproiciproducens sp. NJN-50]|uniref:cytidylate kinase-like family protein n=1 Tax=Acutalibacteraceae TaxID=3082771 RepID=UPI000FFE1738|nr:MULTISPECIES: cytidylate kinase-like family protein [Acutalibacteraceae]QAT50190.1 cytidylate kinase-like family protein [Caproiciproducens sp. NJN-50]
MKIVITIARQYGSGGREIGRRLAKRFSIPFYDRELIAAAAKRSGLSREILEQADEKVGSSLLYAMIMGNYPYVDSGAMAAGRLPVNDRLFQLQAKLIREAAGNGPCVIVGRCADDILRGRENVFSVFLYADLTFRKERAVKEYGVQPESAAGWVAKQDKQRAGYYHFYTDEKWGETGNYHLCVDSSCFGISGAEELIARAVLLRENRTGQE